MGVDVSGYVEVSTAGRWEFAGRLVANPLCRHDPDEPAVMPEPMFQSPGKELAAIEGVTLLAPAEAHGAVAAFRIEGWDAATAAAELGRSVFAIIEADAEADVIRASVGAWNRESEISRFTGRVAELAAHTPETLPRRPSLTIISGSVEPQETE